MSTSRDARARAPTLREPRRRRLTPDWRVRHSRDTGLGDWAGERQMILNNLINRRVIVRSNMAGVYVGTLVEVGSQGWLRLQDGHQLYDWRCANGVTLCGLAAHGGVSTRMDPFGEIVLSEFVAVIGMADGAQVSRA